MTPKQWTIETNAIGIVSKQGRGGGTYAQKDIAFEFASWISVEFKLYLIKEFQRLKDGERKQLGWDIRRNLTKINYRIHTDAVKENLIPPELTMRQTNLIYASEADVLSMALFGMTAKEWRDSHPGEKGNIRDYANVSQLVCLSNLENLNAIFIQEKMPQAERLRKLNQIAIQQMRLLTNDTGIKRLEVGGQIMALHRTRYRAPLAPITLKQLQSFTAPMLSRNPALHYVFARMGMAGVDVRTIARQVAGLIR